MLLIKLIKRRILLLLCLIPSFIFAQNELKGRVVSHDKKPVESVEIIIKKDSQIISTYTTMLDGEFKFDIQNGIYTVLMLDQSKTLYEKSIEINSSLDLGDIEVSVEKVLAEVVISKSSKKRFIERKSDKYIVNVENSINAVGSDVMTLISKTPGIRVSKGVIKISGKEGVLVSINGKILQLSSQDLEDYLKSIPSTDISKIEVITNPSSKYDAQGSSGILNLVLKKGIKKGYGGTISSTYSQHKFANFGNNINLSRVGNKGSLNSSFNYEVGKDFVEQNVSSYFPDIQSIGDREVVRDFKKINFNSDFQFLLSKKDKLNLGVLYSERKSINNASNKVEFKDWSDNLEKYNDGINDIDLVINKKSMNVLYNRDIDSLGTNLSVEADWFQNSGGFNQLITGIDYDADGNEIDGGTNLDNRSKSRIKTDIYSLNTIYTLPTKIAEFTFGGKWLYINLITNSTVSEKVDNDYVLNPDLSSNSYYVENRQSIFFSLKKEINKWLLEGGLRFENTLTHGNTFSTIKQPFKNNYNNLFPSLNITYNLNSDNIFSLVYGKRINRAEFRLLNPFRNYYNAYDYWEGNPFVLPSVTNNINLNYTYKSKHSLDLAYSYTKDGFEQISFFLPDNVVAHKVVNYMNLNSLILTAATGFTPFKWMSTNFQLQGFKKINKSYLEIIDDTDLWGWYTSINNSMSLNKSKTLNAEVNFWYSSGNLELEAYQKKQYSLDLAFNTMLLNKDLVISISGSDVLRTMWETFSLTSTGINQKLVSYWQPPTYRFSLQYKFGNRKIQHKNRKAENSQEQNR
jgi:hypothetical protein